MAGKSVKRRKEERAWIGREVVKHYIRPDSGTTAKTMIGIGVRRLNHERTRSWASRAFCWVGGRGHPVPTIRMDGQQCDKRANPGQPGRRSWKDHIGYTALRNELPHQGLLGNAGSGGRLGTSMVCVEDGRSAAVMPGMWQTPCLHSPRGGSPCFGRQRLDHS